VSKFSSWCYLALGWVFGELCGVGEDVEAFGKVVFNCYGWVKGY